MDIYAEEIIAHFEHPHNKGMINEADASFHEYNPVCGDDLTIFLTIENGKVKDAKFSGNGCAISVGAASMLTDLLKDKSVEEVEKMGVPTVVKMLGIDPGPVRLKCATLSLKAAQKAVFIYQKKDTASVSKEL